MVGGIVPDVDEKDLLAAGVSRVVHPGSSMQEISVEVARLARCAREQAPDII